MEFAALKAFVAVAETGSFSIAAEHLFLTQPAVSKRIAALESELDTRLFDRIGRTVTLTEGGSALLPRARNMLMELEDSIRAISSLSGQVRGTLRFATSHHIGLHRLPATLKHYTQAYPQVRLDIRFMDSEAACVAVEHGDLELGIVTLPPVPPGNLYTEVIWQDPLGVVVSHNHPLTGKTDVTLNELAQHVAVLPSTNTYTRQIAEQAFSHLGLALEIALSTNYLETIKMLVSVGIGWSLLPNTMLDRHVCMLPVEELALQRSLGIVYHRERTLSNAARALINDLGPVNTMQAAALLPQMRPGEARGEKFSDSK